MTRLSVVSSLILAIILAAACGPPRGRSLDKVNERGAEHLCKDFLYSMDQCGPGDDDEEPSAISDSDCEDFHDNFIEELPDSCEATVGEARDCYRSCFEDDEVCDPVLRCIVGLD